jgi:uncharacterized protein (TIGR00255 family)
MTGFGRGEIKKEDYEVVAEVRSVNNRYLDVQIRLPRNFSHLENEVKALVRNFVTRGRLNIFVNLKSNQEELSNGLTIDKDAARIYWNLLKALKRELKIPGRLKLDHLLHFSDVITYDEERYASDGLWQAIEAALIMALEQLQQMRQQEGKQLAQDLEQRIILLTEKIARIEAISSQRANEELPRLRQKIQEILNDTDIEASRLETEIALMINRMDVTEECVRFRSHNTLFLELLKSDDASGRKMNFLLQEMTREANTIGAKALQAEIAHLVVDIKEEIEKIREQVQNIE